MGDRQDLQALLRLTAWLSPAFPVGSFAYSGGLEQAVGDGLVGDAAGLRGWLALLVERGTAWNDAVLLAEAHRCHQDPVALAGAAELAEALAGSRERHQETMLLGEAFLAAARAWPHPGVATLPAKLAYPVAVGAISGMHGIELERTLAAFLHAFISQAVSAGIRLGLAGQKDGLRILAALETVTADTAARAAQSSLDDLGSAAIQADIAGLRHEKQATRLFRS
ncbi:urease accessory protein UreF [Rhizobium sp. RAF56]|jgi:urease accessory protein|uniref:urease accessory protein UreF n=1 Tax=Rhizobium sp. RAF56 TaxID=3233062 RepID=UPI003F9B5AB1